MFIWDSYCVSPIFNLVRWNTPHLSTTPPPPPPPQRHTLAGGALIHQHITLRLKKSWTPPNLREYSLLVPVLQHVTQFLQPQPTVSCPEFVDGVSIGFPELVYLYPDLLSNFVYVCMCVCIFAFNSSHYSLFWGAFWVLDKKSNVKIYFVIFVCCLHVFVRVCAGG